MKRFSLKSLTLLWTGVIGLASPCAMFAVPPLPPRPLAVRVQAATHIFVGVAQKLTVMSDGREVKPEPKILAHHQYVMLGVQVDEALTPVGWKPRELIKVPYGGGMFEVESLRLGFLGKKHIYLTRINFQGHNGPYFDSTYSYFLVESLDKKEEILALVKPKPGEAQTWSRMEWLAQCLK